MPSQQLPTHFVFCFLLVTASCTLKAQSNSFTDARDGKTYKTIVIGSQVWMAENLAYAPKLTFTFNNTLDKYYYSDSIYYFCYNDSISNLKKYGALYPWYTARNVCPSGWHLPSEKEFEALFDAAGKDKRDAYVTLIDGGSSGFNAILCGELYEYQNSYPRFMYNGKYTFYWTSSPHRFRAGFWKAGKKVVLNKSTGEDAYPVRCVRN